MICVNILLCGNAYYLFMIRRLVIRIINGKTVVAHRPTKGNTSIRLANGSTRIRFANGSTRIRPANVNAPEMSEYGYFAAKDRLERRLEGKMVDAIPVGKSNGRTVVKVKKSSEKVQ